jgi:hypothetical protein
MAYDLDGTAKMRRPSITEALDVESTTTADSRTKRHNLRCNTLCYRPVPDLGNTLRIQRWMMVQHSGCTGHSSERGTKFGRKVSDDFLAWHVGIAYDSSLRYVRHADFSFGVDYQHRADADASGLHLIAGFPVVGFGVVHVNLFGYTLDKVHKCTLGFLEDPGGVINKIVSLQAWVTVNTITVISRLL